VVLCAKGIERESGKLQGEIAAEVMPGVTLAVLSGPTFAEEVALGLPTAVTLACADTATGESLMHMLGTPTFRPYASTDIVGAQIGGALKNVIAIACGIVDGRGLGHNARAALIARGVAEIARLGAALGASERTLLGLSGVGDLTLTCTSAQSRNYALGAALGAGEIKAGDALAAHTVTEGVHSGPGVLARAASFGLDMPISAAVTDILHAGADIRRTIDTLLSRPFRQEHGSA
ncbi:MAG: NAD(P)H-dependent glycerol-3-phosphate dehydrogenase, partial [Alphaproteobacteria bacterium]|nr:NAD(P)H-dependent glycerol-3-phosphate dehydrogenase [Alphaproteobacteria bacterium]